MTFAKEKDLQNEIANNQNLQRDICAALDVDFYQTRLFQHHIDRKTSFLHHLKGKNLTYKRYTKSPLRYGGGKSLAVGLILEQIPSNTKRFISPFIGGGSVEVAVALELDIEVLAFDIFDILVNFWQVLCKDSHALYKELLKLEPTK